MSKCNNPNCPNVPPSDWMTEPCVRFFHQHNEILGFITFVANIVTDADKKAKKAAEVLFKICDDDEEERARFQKIAEHGAGAEKTLSKYVHFIKETMISHAVDNYLNYIAELLGLIFRTRPDTLKSNETVKVDELLQHSTMEELIDALAEKRIEKLSYQGMRELHSYLNDRLGFALFDSEEDEELQRAIFLIEARNVIVHNRAIVNKKFKSRVPWSPSQVGERITFKQNYEEGDNDVFAHVAFLAKSAREIDQKAAKKFGLALPISRDEFYEEQKSRYSDGC